MFDEIRKEFALEREEHERKNDAWWNELTEEEREYAFYAVMKRVYQAEIIDKGSYRHALYGVFGFDMGMYKRGMDCGYMAIHNSIMNDEEMSIIHRYDQGKLVEKE